MSKASRVLVVSFFYPPDPAVGGRRVAKFVEYLPELGWDPVVLTAQRPGDAPVPPAPVEATPWFAPWRRSSGTNAGPDDRSASGPSLRERLSRRGPLARAAYFALRHVLPMSSVRMPDATLGWVRPATAAGRRLLADGGFTALFSSAGPPSSHLVAGRLQRSSGLPWIADFRDLWSENAWDHRIPPFRWLERRLERRVLRPADVLTTVSRAWGQRLADLHGKPIEVIYNGYDPDDYPTVAPAADGFTLLYVGSLYWPQQDPGPCFAAIRRLLDRAGPELDAAGFRVAFLGTSAGVVEPLARRYELGDRVERLESVPHPESLARQRAASALLYLGWTDPGDETLTAKLFEYLGAGRPILGVGPPDGEAARILESCGHARPSADPASLAATLERWIHTYDRAGQLAAGHDPTRTRQYTRRAQTLRLARRLDRLAGEEMAAGESENFSS